MTTHLTAGCATLCCAALAASISCGKTAFAQQSDAKNSQPPPMSASSQPEHAPGNERPAVVRTERERAPTLPLPPPQQPQSKAAEVSHPTQTKGVFGALRIGPVIGVGLPDLLSLGLTAKLTPYFGAGVNFGLIPTLHIPYYGAATLAYRQFDVYARIYPFGGAFFVGAGAGYASIHGTLDNRFDLSGYTGQFPQLNLPSSVDYTSSASVSTLVLTPQLGFLEVLDSGFCFGIDLGAQLPIAPSQVQFSQTTSGLPPQIANQFANQYLAPNDKSVNDTLQKVGRTPIPTLSMHFGWLFLRAS